MSFVDGALKTSAIVCMTAVTVTLSITTAGAVMYGPTIAQSIISTSDEISQTSSSIRGLTNSLNNSVGIVNSFLEEACKSAGISMKAISDMLVCLAELMNKIYTGVSTLSFKEDRAKVSALLASITTAVDTITVKIGEIKGISAKEINKTISEVNKTIAMLNEGVGGFFYECGDEKTKQLNLTKAIKAIKTFLRMFNEQTEQSPDASSVDKKKTKKK